MGMGKSELEAVEIGFRTTEFNIYRSFLRKMSIQTVFEMGLARLKMLDVLIFQNGGNAENALLPFELGEYRFWEEFCGRHCNPPVVNLDTPTRSGFNIEQVLQPVDNELKEL